MNRTLSYLAPVEADTSPEAIRSRIVQAQAILDQALTAGSSTIQPRARLEQLGRELDRALADVHLARADQENRAAEITHARAAKIAAEQIESIETKLAALAAPAFI